VFARVFGGEAAIKQTAPVRHEWIWQGESARIQLDIPSYSRKGYAK
jgi:hypothetical protein